MTFKVNDKFRCTSKILDSNGSYNTKIWNVLGDKPWSVLSTAPSPYSQSIAIKSIMRNVVEYSPDDFGDGFWCLFTKEDLEKGYIERIEDKPELEIDEPTPEGNKPWVVMGISTHLGSKTFDDFDTQAEAEEFAFNRKRQSPDVKVIICEGIFEVECVMQTKEIK